MKLFSKKTSLDSLRAAVVSGEADLIATEREIETTAAARAAALLDDDEAVALRADDEARRAVLRRDRANARLEASRTALAEAEDAEANANRAARRKALDATNATLRDRLTSLLTAAAADFRSLIGDLEAQRNEVRVFNADLPAGEQQIPDPEAFRSVLGDPEEVISETTADEWCREGESVPLIAKMASRVTPSADGKTGWLSTTYGSDRVVLRKVRRRMIHERTNRVFAEPLATALSIPGVLATDRPAWRPTDSGDVATALEALARPPSPRQRSTRELVDILDN